MGRRTLPGAVVPATRDWQRSTFGPYGRGVLRALAEAFFTDPDDPSDRGAGLRFDWLVDDVDDFISRASPALRNGVRIALVLIDLAPIFFVGRLRRCGSLSLADRERYLAKIEESQLPRVSLLVVMFKTLMTVLYFEHPEAAPHLGYDGRHERAQRLLPSVPQ